jgi:hypothetical protein
MAVKLAVLKSGEDVVADIKELVDDDGNTVSLIFSNPVVAKLITNATLVGDESPNEYKVSFFPWIPLSEDKNVPVRRDWVVAIVEPVEMVKTSYIERMKGVEPNGTESSDASVLSEQYIPDF